jgi:hypothetical protein
LFEFRYRKENVELQLLVRISVMWLNIDVYFAEEKVVGASPSQLTMPSCMRMQIVMHAAWGRPSYNELDSSSAMRQAYALVVVAMGPTPATV